MMIRTEMYIEMLAWYDDSVWAIGPDVYMLLVGCNVCSEMSDIYFNYSQEIRQWIVVTGPTDSTILAWRATGNYLNLASSNVRSKH